MKNDDEDKNEALSRLTPLQREVTQKGATEPAFQNEFWNHKEDGVFVDVVSGEPLFASLHKVESDGGWPTFVRPLVPGNLLETTDRGHGMVRTEVRSRKAGSHLGHVFPDGPGPTGQRYCINSAALRFVPRAELEAQGFGEFLGSFESEDETQSRRSWTAASESNGGSAAQLADRKG